MFLTIVAGCYYNDSNISPFAQQWKSLTQELRLLQAESNELLAKYNEFNSRYAAFLMQLNDEELEILNRYTSPGQNVVAYQIHWNELQKILSSEKMLELSSLILEHSELQKQNIALLDRWNVHNQQAESVRQLMVAYYSRHNLYNQNYNDNVFKYQQDYQNNLYKRQVLDALNEIDVSIRNLNYSR